MHAETKGGLRVTRNDEESRYELWTRDELVGIADFRARDGVVEFPHTVIQPQRRGEGLGDELVQQALDDTRQRGHTVVPTCWFVAQFIDEHPDYHDLLAG